jgi:hypothetical protein
MPEPQSDTYTLTFRPLPDEAPAAIRVRRLLKHALRALRLKCVRIVDLPPDPSATQPSVSPPDAPEAKPGALPAVPKRRCFGCPNGMVGSGSPPRNAGARSPRATPSTSAPAG